ncbi:hypothetical protein TrST_g2019 [Triparma strigata]|uniref:Uncharacterized protein n=1 Tax=Triparma strigata TaxID=1606541 RepID=A0A9W7EPK9_9STRA|nr:hypothetical protein TrST_g2019 [Triparma strigata]
MMRSLLGIKILAVCFISLTLQPSAFNLRIASRTRAATLTKFTSSSSTTSSFGLRHPRRVYNPSFNRPELSTSLSSFGGPPGLPPSGGGPNGNNDQIVSSLVSISLFGLFFFSPIGKIFFSVTNGLFILAFSIPLLAFAAFSVYNTFFLVKDSCPSCGAAAVAPRSSGDGTSATSFCLSCGSTIRATRDNKGLELCNPTPDFDRESESSNPFADIFGSERAARSTTADKGDSASVKRSNTVIDVDVEIKPADDDE